MKPLATADLKHRITIRRPSEVPNGKGGYETTWTTIARPYAEVTSLDGREAAVDRVLEGISVYRIRIRWRADLDVRASDQVQFAGRELNVSAPAADPDGERKVLVITADTAAPRSED